MGGRGVVGFDRHTSAEDTVAAVARPRRTFVRPSCIQSTFSLLTDPAAFDPKPSYRLFDVTVSTCPSWPIYVCTCTPRHEVGHVRDGEERVGVDREFLERNEAGDLGREVCDAVVGEVELLEFG